MNPLDTFITMQKKQKNQIYETDSVSGGMQNLDDKIAMNQVAIAQSLADQQKQQMEPSYGATMGETSEYSPSMPINEIGGSQGVVIPSNAPVTQRFGNYNPGVEVFNKSGINTGTDFGIKEGTPLALPPGQWQVVDAYNKASGKGYIGNNQNSGYGNSILVKNVNTGETMRFSHLSGVNVQPGKVYEGGTIIGASGATGNVTGAHLDLEYKTPSGVLADILKSPYARYLFGASQ